MEIKTFKPINEDNFIITYVPLINRVICENHGLDYNKVILNEKSQNILAFGFSHPAFPTKKNLG